MSIYKKLIGNSLIFAIGNLGSKLIFFFLVPLYTYYLTTSEFGLVDLLTTTISLLLPIFTLSIFDSVLRFVMDNKYDKQAVLINALAIASLGFFLLILIYPILIIIFPFDDYIPYFYFLFLIQSINTILTQYIRANGMIRLFAINGILNALILLVSNLVLLMLYDKGILGYLMSLIIGYTVSSVFVTILGKVLQAINFKKVDIQLMREMLKYSIPLIPNALMWWIMGLSDRYIITYFLGLSANGLYAVANKVPSILSVVNSIFFQAWQMSAIEEADSKDKSELFSNVFNVFSIVMLLSTSFLIVHLKLIIDLLTTEGYFPAWKYVPFLLLGVVFSSFSGFLGTNYIAAKKTTGVFKTSVVGAVINIIVSLILIPIIGINGASLGTMLSFAIIWILRIKDTKDFVNIKLNVRKLLLTLITLTIQTSLLYMNLTFEYVLQVILLMIIVLINFHEIKDILTKFIGVIINKYKRS